MKRVNFFIVIFAGLLVFFSFSIAKAQNELSADAPNKAANRQPRPNLFAELGLSQNQRQQIRRFNDEKKPLARAAQERLRAANRNLDEAIYSNNVNEAEIQTRLRDVQTAHAEVIRIRFVNELAVRKILTAEQLAKFRNLRERFAQSIENNAEQPPPNRPVQNLKQRLKLRQTQMRPN